MVVPLVGMKISLSGRLLKFTRGRPGQSIVVIKSSVVGGGSSSSSGGGGGVVMQTLSESKKEEIQLVAPDEISAKQW